MNSIEYCVALDKFVSLDVYFLGLVDDSAFSGQMCVSYRFLEAFAFLVLP